MTVSASRSPERRFSAATVVARRPVEPVQRVQNQARPFPSEHGELLSEGDGFVSSVTSTAQEDANGGNK